MVLLAGSNLLDVRSRNVSAKCPLTDPVGGVKRDEFKHFDVYGPISLRAVVFKCLSLKPK